MRREDLIAFEDDIADLFNAGKIPYPVHFSNGNEDALIEAFKDIRPDDWILGSWRFHYQCLLKGVPPEELKAAILEGRSIGLCFPKYRVLTSAVVGGALPIAVGIAMGIKRSRGTERVHCWAGDMTERTGIARECMAYGHDLPIRWIVEENGYSVCTPVREVWGEGKPSVVRYAYKSRFPHAGAGKRVMF
jgi:pyruvate dehydrogenase E1 component alpha subunit